MIDDARIIVNEDGSWADANPAALEVLGVPSTDQLLRLPSDAFALTPSNPDETTAFREAWVAGGSAPIVGESQIRRADGGVIAVKFLIARQPDSRYLVVLREIEPTVERPTLFVSAGEALSAWRAAERRLEALEPGTPEWDTATAEIARFRKEYRRLFDEVRGR